MEMGIKLCSSNSKPATRAEKETVKIRWAGFLSLTHKNTRLQLQLTCEEDIVIVIIENLVFLHTGKKGRKGE